MERRLYNHHHGMHSNDHPGFCIYIATPAEILAAAASLDGAEPITWCTEHASPQHGGREHCQVWYTPTDVEGWCEFDSCALIPLETPK